MSDLSVQLYSVRDALATDFDGTIGRLAAFGFTQIEPYGLDRFADELASALPAHGLSAPTAHVDLLTGDRTSIFATASELGVGTVIQPMTDPSRWTSASDVSDIALALNAAASEAAGFGLRVGYHNHHFELAEQIEGQHALEFFAGQLHDDVVLELDTYWAYAGGADVPALLTRLGGRVTALHIKDGDGSLDVKKQVPAGSGVVPVADILAAAPSALRVIEFDDTEGDVLDGVRVSREFVLGLGTAA